MSSDPAVVSEYCNGSRQPPECTVANGCGGLYGFGVPPGIADSVVPNPVFSLTPSATVDEGNNWINISWGPLSLTNPSLTGGLYSDYGGGPMLGNYALTSASPAVDYIPTSASLPAGVAIPATDFFGHPRPDSGACVDVGAVEFPKTATGSCVAVTPTLTSIVPALGARGGVVAVTLTGTNFAAGATLNTAPLLAAGITVSGVTVVSATRITATFTISGRATLGADNVTVTSGGVTTAPVTFTVVAAPTLATIAPISGSRATGVVPVTLTGTNFYAGATVAVSGGGVTVSGVTVVSTTQITATFTIGGGAALTARNVTVTSGGVTTAPPPTVTFTVNP
jgi:hypothetical protein